MCQIKRENTMRSFGCRHLALLLIMSVLMMVGVSCSEEINPNPSDFTHTVNPPINEETDLTVLVDQGSRPPDGQGNPETIVMDDKTPWPESLPEAIGRPYTSTEDKIKEIIFGNSNPDVFRESEPRIYRLGQKEVNIDDTSSAASFDYQLNFEDSVALGYVFSIESYFDAMTRLDDDAKYHAHVEFTQLSQTEAKTRLIETLTALGFANVAVRDWASVDAGRLNQMAQALQEDEDGRPDDGISERLVYKQDWKEQDNRYVFSLFNLGPYRVPVFTGLRGIASAIEEWIPGGRLAGAVSVDGVTELSLLNFYVFLDEDNVSEPKRILTESEMDDAIAILVEQLGDVDPPVVIGKSIMYCPEILRVDQPIAEKVNFRPACVVNLQRTYVKEDGQGNEFKYTHVDSLILDAYDGSVIDLPR